VHHFAGKRRRSLPRAGWTDLEGAVNEPPAFPKAEVAALRGVCVTRQGLDQGRPELRRHVADRSFWVRMLGSAINASQTVELDESMHLLAGLLGHR
jgi:hypothetical protein